MVRVFRLVPVVAAFLIALSVTSVAFAAPAAWQSVDVTLHSDPSGSVLLVAGELSPETPLPAEVELSVPSGSQIQWIGEVLGGATSEDPEVEFVKSTSGGADVYRATLTKSRVAQIEVTAVGVDTFDGSTYGTTLMWAPSQDVPTVRISARVPQGGTIVEASPGASMLPGDAGYTFYSKSVENVRAGEPVELAFTYTLPAVTPSGSTAAPSGNQSTAALVAVLALVGAIAIAIGVRRKLARKASAAQATEPDAKAERVARTHAGGTETEDPLEPADGPARGLGPRTLYLVAAIVVVGLVAAIVVIEQKPTASAFIDGKLTKQFGAAPCESVSIPLTVNEGVDLEASGGKLIDALEGIPSLSEVTVNLDPPSIVVGYCASSVTEAQVREALAKPGIVTLGASTAKAAEPATATPAP